MMLDPQLTSVGGKFASPILGKHGLGQCQILMKPARLSIEMGLTEDCGCPTPTSNYWDATLMRAGRLIWLG